jgi:polyketide biosynthesis enoyl-CoA hydratase PksH
MTSVVAVDARRPLVRATLNGADTRNRLDEPTLLALSAALDRAERTDGTEVFVLDAVGAAFCAGIALEELEDTHWRPPIAAAQTLLSRLSESPLVTVAIVNGRATGGGVGLAAACDHVIAGPGSSFRLTEVLLGLVPAVVLPVLARRVGPHRAYSLALTARELSGTEAVQLGLADQYAESPAADLRRLLVGLRSAEQGAVHALKRYRSRLFPAVPQHMDEEAVLTAFLERLSDPVVRERLGEFARQGLLP